MHYTTIDPYKVKDSNPRPSTTPPLTPKMSKTMHYTTIDSQKDVLQHHWHPQRQIFEPTTMHYTTIPQKVKDSNYFTTIIDHFSKTRSTARRSWLLMTSLHT
jgi:hypothetical protein